MYTTYIYAHVHLAQQVRARFELWRRVRRNFGDEPAPQAIQLGWEGRQESRQVCLTYTPIQTTNANAAKADTHTPGKGMKCMMKCQSQNNVNRR